MADVKQYAPPLLPGLSRLDDGKLTYSEFRKTLTTPYLRARLGVITTWLGIAACLVVAGWENFRSEFFLPLILVLSLLQHRIMNVLHEGSHYLLAKSRVGNDVFSNVFSGWFVLADVKAYRKLQVLHHKNLGDELDPKKSHMEKLDLTLLLAAFSGFGSLRILRQRKKFKDEHLSSQQTDELSPMIPILGLIMHLMIAASLLNYMSMKQAVIWIVCTFFVTPGLGIVRNILEHRYVETVDVEVWELLMGKAISNESPSQVTTRIFTLSKLSSIWGSMGFTRHLIHHWDPSISFLNLDKVHNFLLNTQIGEQLRAMDTTFSSTFIQLWGKSKNV